MALARMAVRRGAAIGELELGVFSEDLLPFDLIHVHSVLERIGMRPVAEYESPLPPGNYLVAAVAKRQYEHETRILPDQFRPEVREALQRAEAYKRLQPGELVDVRPDIEDAVKRLKPM